MRAAETEKNVKTKLEYEKVDAVYRSKDGNSKLTIPKNIISLYSHNSEKSPILKLELVKQLEKFVWAHFYRKWMLKKKIIDFDSKSIKLVRHAAFSIINNIFRTMKCWKINRMWHRRLQLKSIIECLLKNFGHLLLTECVCVCVALLISRVLLNYLFMLTNFTGFFSFIVHI